MTEKDIIKAGKMAEKLKLKYSILSLNELPKRFTELIGALQNIKDVGKVE